jgi:membrane protein DedA with SNARE-associated domain
MEQFTLQVVELIKHFPPLLVYLAFFGIAYLENIVPPIPGDVLVAFAGYLAAEHIIGLAPVYLLTTAASVIGFMSMYAIGSRWGTSLKRDRKEHWIVRFIDLKYIEKAQRWMQRWGQGVVLANRFLAGTRSVISLTAGISHINVTKTVVSSTVSSLLWNAILIGFGWVVHEQWQTIGHYLSIYSRIILIGIALFLIIRLLIRKYPKWMGTE